MDSLVQAIKDLDPIKFQQFCFQLMSEKFPSANIQYVDGASGDEGIDFFTGVLSKGPTVWQTKAFQVGTLGDSQKAQIRKSLRDAFIRVGPTLWILCLNINMDTKAQRWFQRLQKSYAANGLIVANPVQGLDLAREVIFRKTLRNYYFPNTSLEVADIKALLVGTAPLDDSSLEKLATENVEQWLERIGNQDPRFFFEVTFGGERGPDVFPPPHEQGLIAAVTDGRKTIKAFVRDVQALQLDPVGFKLHTSNDGTRKVFELMRTGREQRLESTDILGFSTNLPLLSAFKFEAGKISLIARSVPDETIIPLRLTFRNSSGTAILSYVPFKKTRAGTDEVELSANGDAALHLALVLPKDASRPGTVTVSRAFVRKRIQVVANACKVLKLLQEGCDIELFGLQVDAKLGVIQGARLDMGLTPGFFGFIDELLMISTRFNADLILPDKGGFQDDEEQTFRLLRAFALNEEMRVDGWTLKLIKSRENAEELEKQLQSAGAFRIEPQSACAILFGNKIEVGPCAIQVDRGEITNLPEALARFKQASIGESVPFSVRPLIPVRFSLCSAQHSANAYAS